MKTIRNIAYFLLSAALFATSCSNSSSTLRIYISALSVLPVQGGDTVMYEFTLKSGDDLTSVEITPVVDGQRQARFEIPVSAKTCDTSFIFPYVVPFACRSAQVTLEVNVKSLSGSCEKYIHVPVYHLPVYASNGIEDDDLYTRRIKENLTTSGALSFLNGMSDLEGRDGELLAYQGNDASDVLIEPLKIKTLPPDEYYLADNTVGSTSNADLDETFASTLYQGSASVEGPIAEVRITGNAVNSNEVLSSGRLADNGATVLASMTGGQKRLKKARQLDMPRTLTYSYETSSSLSLADLAVDDQAQLMAYID